MSSSTTPLYPYWLYAYQVIVDTTGGQQLVVSDSNTEPGALRVTFMAEQTALAVYWFAEVTIWNLNESTQSVAIEQGNIVTICAGFKYDFKSGGVANVIWKGRVFQGTWDRVGVTDFKLTLRCLVGLYEDSQTYVNLTIAAGQTQLQAVQQVASQANITIENLDTDALSEKTYPKAKTITGLASLFFSQIAADTHLTYWLSPNGLNIRSLIPKSTTPDVVYGPSFPDSVILPAGSISPSYKPTLIGTPQLTEQGATWRVLMDSQVKLGMLAKLEMAVMRQLPIYPGVLPSAALLNQDRTFVVAGLHYAGDTRGEEWYTEIVGVTPIYPTLQAGVMGLQQ